MVVYAVGYFLYIKKDLEKMLEHEMLTLDNILKLSSFTLKQAQNTNVRCFYLFFLALPLLIERILY